MKWGGEGAGIAGLVVVTGRVTREAEKPIFEQSGGGRAMVNLLEIGQGDHKTRCAWDGPRILALPWSSYASAPFCPPTQTAWPISVWGRLLPAEGNETEWWCNMFREQRTDHVSCSTVPQRKTYLPGSIFVIYNRIRYFFSQIQYLQ